jgi:hypothetical protein
MSGSPAANALVFIGKIAERIKSALLRRTWWKEVLVADNAERAFTLIYERNLWGGNDSGSGRGSSFSETAKIRETFPWIVETFRIRSIFDAPCGDFNWMRHVLSRIDVDYLGVDIVESVVARNTELFGAPRVKFCRSDIRNEAFPKADLWVCRDCLFHLSYEHTFEVLGQFIRSEIPLALISTHKPDGGFTNRDIVTGDFRRTDLFSEPYCFDPVPLFRFNDYVDRPGRKEMCLWTKDQVLRSWRRYMDSCKPPATSTRM